MVLDGRKEAIYLAGNKKGKTVQYSYHDSPCSRTIPLLRKLPYGALHGWDPLDINNNCRHPTSGTSCGCDLAFAGRFALP
jgi:hypothetical protein